MTMKYHIWDKECIRFFVSGEKKNIGAKKACTLGCQMLVFLDADTKVCDIDLLQGYLDRIQPGVFGIVSLRDQVDVPDLTGFLVLHTVDYIRSGGYDENIHGWGGEDSMFRMQLALGLAMNWNEIPYRCFEPIHHSHQNRTMFYHEKDYVRSNAHNMLYVYSRIDALKAEFGDQDIDRLLFQHTPNV